MLSSESIHQQMRNMSNCSTRQLSELKELMDLYPYASSLVTLYLKSLANDHDLRLSSQLEKYAFQIPNRALLYDLLVTQTTAITQEIHSQEAVSQEVLVEEVAKVPEAPIIQLTVDPAPMVVAPSVIEEETEELETLIAPVASVEMREEGDEESSLNIPHQPVETREMDEVDTMIQSAVISSSYLQLAYPGAAEQVAAEEELRSNEEEAIIPSQSLENVKSIEPKSFTDWLKMGEILNGSEEEPLPEEKKPSFYHFEKPKKEFFSPAKKAKESVDENKMPVSETLAQVFALQGNINKAIHVYEQLILIFPEKKSFFASQIRNLKRKLNS
jgi:hypothetical protein